jgi:hypothetical protein
MPVGIELKIGYASEGQTRSNPLLLASELNYQLRHLCHPSTNSPSPSHQDKPLRTDERLPETGPASGTQIIAGQRYRIITLSNEEVLLP